MAKLEGLEFLYRMFERRKWNEIRLKDLEIVCIAVSEMERQKEEEI